MGGSRKSEKNKGLMQGVLVLMPAALFTKCVGLFYKIPLLFIVGVEGMAYFLAAYHVYSLLFALCATGLPTALSLQVSGALARGEYRAVRRILGVSLVLFLSVGLGGTLLLAAFANPLAARLAMPSAAAALLAIAPALALSAFIGAAKGYFPGHSKMGATAVCEVLEALGKLVFGLGFALYGKRLGLPAPQIAALAVLGITVGLALSALFLLVLLLRDLWQGRARLRDNAPCPTRRTVLSSLLRVALPVTLGASVMSLVTLLDTALISSRLQALGTAPDTANMLYSSYGNLAVPLYNLVPSLLAPVTLSLTPLFCRAFVQRDTAAMRGTLVTAWRIVLLVGVPASMALSLFSTPLLSMIYAGQESAILVAAPLLSVLALAVLPCCMMALTGACCQATGHVMLPVAAMGAGALVKLLSEYFLLAVPQLGMRAVPLSTLFCTLTVLVIEWVGLSRILWFPVLCARDLFRPLLAGSGGTAAGLLLYLLLQHTLGSTRFVMLPVAAFAALCVLLFALLLGALQKSDLQALPRGERLVLLLQKIKLLK